MKKYLLYILVLLIIPISAFADTSDDSKITIKDLILKKSIGNTEEVEAASITNKTINLNLKMYEVEDSVEYSFKIMNESSEDYYIVDRIESNHIEYKIISNNNSYRIEAGKEKEFRLVATYAEELAKTDFRSGKYDASTQLNLSVIPESIYNPKTGSFFFRILGLLILAACVTLFVDNKKVRITSFILVCVLIPYTSHAACKVNIELNSNLIVGYVVPNPCTYDGNLVQGAEYTNGQYTYRYMQEYGYSSGNYVWVNMSNDGWGVRLTDVSSTAPVTTTLCTSINDKPIVSMSFMFYQSKTTSIDTSSFDTSNVVNMGGMFLESKITSIDLLNFDTSNVTMMPSMFNGCSDLTSIDVSAFDTSKVLNMCAMFKDCRSLTEINMSGFDLSNGSSFSSIAGAIFSSTPSLNKINLSYMKLPVDMTNSVFRNSGASTSPIEEVDVTGWDLSKTTNAFGMFGSNGEGGTGLKTIKGLDTWDTSHITNMGNMFQGLTLLTELDVSSFDTSNVTKMSNMFQGLSSITELDLSSFDTSNVSDMTVMFYTDSQLRTIYVSDSFVTNNVSSSSSMFSSCNALVGGNGTTYNSNYMDKTYARIDVSGTPGYFTRKATS